MTAPMRDLVATYRLQLRGGVGLAEARGLLPWLVELGVSHLYLSPLFRAGEASTHGYDVIDPNEVDPAVGGEAAFVALADAAREAGIGIVLDIVPNHMAFTPDNPFIADIMRRGRDSRFAKVFDLDWDRGPLHFPFIDGSLEDTLAKGAVALSALGDALCIQGVCYPLRPTPLARDLAGRKPDYPSLSALMEQQFWSVGDWRTTAGAIIHRRFFNISGLVGVRQEDPEVFALTHRWIVEQSRTGRIQGLRIDHIDGLARPACYLHRLREAVGDMPIWIEKIVKDGETIPAGWPIEGMSGYEFLAPITRLLTDPGGLDALRTASMGAVPADTGAEVRRVRRELLATSLNPELRRVRMAALEALGCGSGAEAAVSRALTELAVHWPVYRSYTADGYLPNAEMETLRSVDAKAGWLLDLLHAAADEPAAASFAARFEQLTGALTAKSEEDTVFFRAVSYLPFCEVGIGPECGAIDAVRFARTMQERAKTSPLALSTLSTHDTKRSADARAAIAALSHVPEIIGPFTHRATRRAQELDLPERWGIYAVQCALALLGEPEAEARLCAHMAKAMREAKDISSHEAPDEQAERRGGELAGEMLRIVEGTEVWPGDTRARYERMFEQIVLGQVILQMTAPGVPDIYQGTERLALSLTDPDNRRLVDFGTRGAGAGSLSTRKLELTRDLLALRARHEVLFTHGGYAIRQGEGTWTIVRDWQGGAVELDLRSPDSAVDGPILREIREIARQTR
ncbi:(1-_4)-alpha-D-glucan 1-alpha-D-glucosylmutase [Novosphingobium sp. PhB165]|uniref:malto-oligosyltrehalose synthase n=1 Tax=Novosphingobium sp. PhB165 TaxID=2485105 RepID=UPI00104BEE38|nr:malto-oligosyltrehalose synthase [Novosphingobium sp. PhB165]TCM14416.1 (1->4)-alpha-D-glucan 1-alpha-D-glucosylmutase [Novosphingobium sp. PhB165]